MAVILKGLTVLLRVTVMGEVPLAVSSNTTALPSVYFAALPNCVQFAVVLMSQTPLPTPQAMAGE
jgi:hypothetical protein